MSRHDKRYRSEAMSPDASPSPTETVGGIRPFPRPALTSPLAKTVPCLRSRDLMFFQVYRRLSCSRLSLLVPLGVAPSWALVLRPPITLCLIVAWSLTYHFPRWSRPHRSAGYAQSIMPMFIRAVLILASCVIRVYYLSLFLRFPIYLRCVTHHTLGL